MLVNKTKLRTLGLSNNMIGIGGARELASVCIADLVSLTRLSMESNLIGNDGLLAISNALVNNTSLKEIFLYNNDLDDDTMEVMSAMLSNKLHL